MSVNYSFKHHFNYPFPSPIPSSGPIPAAAPAASLPYTHYGYGGRMFRPRFGFFRRFFWFGLGVGAASWYINKKQEERRFIQSGNADSSAPAPAEEGRRVRWGWCHSDNHNRRNVHSTATAPAAPAIVAPAQDPRPDLRAPFPATTPSAPISPTAAAADDLAALRSTLDRLMREKAAEMGKLQVKARSEAREYAKEKLDKLSVILEGLKETLNKEVEDKAKKLV